MNGGMIQGGVGFVTLAYGLSWAVLAAYMVSLYYRSRDL
jgi:hypothetical protein